MSAFARLRAPMPDHIGTPRLMLRCWEARDAAALKEAIDSSLTELRSWMPWAMHEPSSVDALDARLRGFADDFRQGREWSYGIFDRAETRVLGGAGLHQRLGPNALEIGYWIRTDAKGCGYATEAAAALTAVAFEYCAIDHLEIRCDPRNLRSAAIPRRLGYRHSETRPGDAKTPTGEPRDTMIWTISAADFAARLNPD
jgi:RimJ/RimL family protein N-acetyltransferase